MHKVSITVSPMPENPKIHGYTFRNGMPYNILGQINYYDVDVKHWRAVKVENLIRVM